MYSTIRYLSKPVLNDPWFVEALPGVGNVGKLAGDCIADSLGAEKFAVIYSENFPPQVVPDEDCVVHMACNELWHARTPNGRDVIFLRGDYQGTTPEGQFILAEDILEILLGYGAERIITLGGLGTGQINKEQRVLGAVSCKDLKPELSKAGVQFVPGQPSAGIIGAAGALVGLGQLHGIDSFCIMGETSGYFTDSGAALNVVNVLKKILKLRKVDTKKLKEEAKKLAELTAQAQEQEPAGTIPEDLNYFG